MASVTLSAGNNRTFKVGVAVYPPYVVIDTLTHKLKGFDIEMANYIAQSLGAQFDYRIFTFQQLLDAIQSDTIDMILGCIYVTSDRKKIMNFSIPYMRTGLVIVKRTDEAVEQLQDLKGYRIAVKRKATGQEWAEKHKDEYGFMPIPYNNPADAYKDLQRGYIDALIDDYHHAVYYISRYNLGELDIAGNPLIIREYQVAIGVNKKNKRDRELLSDINTVLSSYFISPEYETSYRKWFLMPSQYYERQKVQVLMFVTGVALLLVIMVTVLIIQSHSRDNLLKIALGISRATSRAINSKNSQYHGHGFRVAVYTELIARRLGIFSYKLKIAAYLHDIGKLVLPDLITENTDMLSMSNDEAYKQHPVLGYLLLREIPALNDIANWIRWHHERWDGRGYPDGLKQTDIPIESRIISIANAFDILTTFSHENAEVLSEEDAKRELLRWAGIIWDPQIVTVAVDVLHKVELISSEAQVYRLLDKIKLQASEDINKLKVVYNIVDLLKETSDPDELLASILPIVRQAYDREAMYFIVMEDEEGKLYVAAQAGAETPSIVGMRLPEGKGITRKAMTEKRFVLVRDANLDPLFVPPRSHDIRSELAIPLLIADEVVGVLDIESKERNAFKTEDIDFLQAMATAIAVVLMVVKNKKSQGTKSTAPGKFISTAEFPKQFQEALENAKRAGTPLSVAVLKTDDKTAIDPTLLPVDSFVVKEKHNYTIVIPRSTYEEAEDILNILIQDCDRCSYGIASYPTDGDSPKKLLAVAQHRLFLGGRR